MGFMATPASALLSIQDLAASKCLGRFDVGSEEPPDLKKKWVFTPRLTISIPSTKGLVVFCGIGPKTKGIFFVCWLIKRLFKYPAPFQMLVLLSSAHFMIPPWNSCTIQWAMSTESGRGLGLF